MPARFAFAVVWVACLSFPAFGADSSFDAAVAKAARISGRWEAKLDQTQSLVFSPDSVSSLILNISTGVRRDGEEVETSLPYLRLDLGLEVGLASPIYDGLHAGNTVPVLTAEDGFQFSGRRSRDAPEITIRAVPGTDANELTALISCGKQSAHVVFVRPAANPDARVQGDWVNGGVGGIAVLHIYVEEPFRVSATLDKIYMDSAELGHSFSDFGSDTKGGSLALWMDSPNSVHSFDGVLRGADLLEVQWRGSGALSLPDFKRLAPGSYPPKAPVAEPRAK